MSEQNGKPKVLNGGNHFETHHTRPERDVVADRERFIEERMDDISEKLRGERK